MDFNALNSFIDEDNASEGYDDLVGFSEGGPVGEDMEDDEQPSLQYFAQGGEVEEAQAILTRMPKPGRAAQMLQSFAEGGEVQKTPFPELLDISKQVNAAGAPVEKLATPTTAPASASVPSQINIPTFQPVAAPPTGPSIMTPTPAPLTGLGAQPTLSQPSTAPTSTARSLFEQINPAALAATPTYTTPTFTPTVQTFTKPTLLTKEELQKAQPPLVRYEPSATYGGLETYKGPLQTSPYVDIPGAPGSDGAPAPAPAAPANMTPGGYKYTTYTSLTPDQLVGLGNKAQLGQTFTGIVKRQQDDATAIRTEFNNAIASGDIETATALRPLLVQKEADLRQAITDQGLVNRYFTGVGGAFETPEQYRQRVQTARLTGSRLGPELTSVSLEGLQYKLPETSAKGAVPTPFAAQINTQKAEYDAAVAVYENLASAYGRENPFVKNYLAEVVTPQKADYDMLIAKPVSTAATAADRLLSSPTLAKAYTPPKLSPTFKVSNTMAAFKGIVGGLETSVRQLTNTRDAAAAAGLTGYVSQLDEALEAEQGKLSKALEDRQAAVDNSLPDPVKRAMGSPPEGEMLESQSRALLKKLSGGSEANTVPLQKFNKGGAVNKAQGSPIYGEIPDSGPITADTRAAFKAKGPSASSVVSDAARLLRNITGEGLSNLESRIRGSVATIPGTFGDIESIFRESDKTRKLATTEEVLRDYMPGRLTKPTKEAKGFEELGTYLPLAIPAGTVSKAATMTGKGVEKGAAKMLERLGPRTGRSWEPLLAQAGAAPMYAVKTKGGAFYPEGMGSGVDTYLDRVVKGLTGAENLAGRDAKAVADFIRTKGRKYLTSVYGTAEDPLRLAVIEGRMPLYGSDQERFRDYLLDAARAGNPNAIKDLERFYDEATHLSTQGYVPAGATDPSYVIGNRMQTAQRERLLAEGVPEDLINPVYPATNTAQQMAETTYSEPRKKLGELLQGMEALPPDMRESYVRGVGDTDKGIQSLLYSATKEQPIYDLATTPSMDFLKPNNLAEGIASIPLRDLERMTFPEAVVKGAQNMRLKRDRGLMLEKARDGKAVPKEIYFDGTQPVYEIDKNQKWVRIMSPDAVELEGAAMRHSIGGYKTKDDYNLGGKKAFNSGLARIFSLRNEKGVPQVTVETKFTDEDGLMIKEVRSKFNSEPTAEEKRAVLQLFETLGPREIRSTTYRNSRTGETLKEEDRVEVNWGDEFKNYMQYKNKGEE